jgi:hypothetical protein
MAFDESKRNKPDSYPIMAEPFVGRLRTFPKRLMPAGVSRFVPPSASSVIDPRESAFLRTARLLLKKVSGIWRAGPLL